MLQALSVALRAWHLFLVRRDVGVIMNVLALLRSERRPVCCLWLTVRRVHSLTNTIAVAVVTDCHDYIVVGSTAVAYVFSITSTLPLCFHLLILM